MKINKMKAMVGVLAVTSVASLVGSVSGTMAWLQYNTRARAEMYGTTAKTTENLQIRTVNAAYGETVRGKFMDKDALVAGVDTPANGDKAVTDDGKVYTYTTAWDNGVTAAVDDHIVIAQTAYKWNGTEWAALPATTYGQWKSALTKEDINASAAAAGHALSEDVFKPVTNPSATKDGALGKFYSHPLCGHEKYDEGEHRWKPATNDAFLQFTVQFKVLDIDGVAGNVDLAKDLYMTDLTINDTVGGKSVKEALRFHVENLTVPTNKLYGRDPANPSTDTEVFTTLTHGNLDLDDDKDPDTVADVPKNYSWTADADRFLDYGATNSQQTYYNIDRKVDGVNKVFATQDQYGALTKTAGVVNGTAIGQTVAGTEGTAPLANDTNYLTFKVTIWLEGWHTYEAAVTDSHSKGLYTVETDHTSVGTPSLGQLVFNSTSKKMFKWTTGAVWTEVTLNDGDIYKLGTDYKVWKATSSAFDDITNTQYSIWDDLKTVGAKFNIGFSFGIEALAPIQE